MNAPIDLEDQAPRLYSSSYVDDVPVDNVAPTQADIHALLLRWGAWLMARASNGGGLASVEALYRKGGGTPPATAPMSADPELMALELAVLKMPKELAVTRFRWVHEGGRRTQRAVTLEAPGLTLRLLYVHRWTPLTVCAALYPPLRPVAWPAHISSSRGMVAFLKRRHGTCTPPPAGATLRPDN